MRSGAGAGALLALVCACGGGRAAPAPVANAAVDNHARVDVDAAITSQVAAIQRVVALHDTIEARASTDQQRTLNMLDDARHDANPATITASTLACADLARQVSGEVGTDRRSLIVGDADALNAEGTRTCWSVVSAYGFTTLVVAITADTGALVLAWLPPEG